MLSEAMSPCLKALKRLAESGCEVSLESGETRRCFPIVMSYCSDIFETKDVSVVWNGAEKTPPLCQVPQHVRRDDNG